jgi:hypothetical protein
VGKSHGAFQIAFQGAVFLVYAVQRLHKVVCITAQEGFYYADFLLLATPEPDAAAILPDVLFIDLVGGVGCDGFTYVVPLPPSPTWVQALRSILLYSSIEETVMYSFQR